MAPSLLLAAAMRALACLFAIASSTLAYAEPPEETQSSFHVSIQPALAFLRRTMNYDSFTNGVGGYEDDASKMKGKGTGVRVEIGLARRLTLNVHLGAVLRVGFHDFDVRFDDGMTDVMSLRPIQLGPQITFTSGRLFFRGDITLGKLPVVEYTAGYDMYSDGLLGMPGVSGEVGYQTPLGAGTFAQFGFGASLAHIRSNEDGDHGEYIDRTYLIAMAATFSIERRY